MPENDLEDRLSSKKNSNKVISGKFDPHITKTYVKGEAFGEVGASLGSIIGAYAGEKLFHGSSRLLNVLSGSIPGDYLLGSAFSGAYFYYKYRDEYKGLSGKWNFIKDQANFHVREAPATIASYLVYSPLVALGLTLGAPATIAAGIASVISSGLYILGSYFLNKRYLKKLAGKKEEKAESPSSPQDSNVLQLPQQQYPVNRAA